jgi:hypothetical protein
MNYIYKVINDSTLFRSDGASIPIAEANKDYQVYLKWLADGNEPIPANEQLIANEFTLQETPAS